MSPPLPKPRKRPAGIATPRRSAIPPTSLWPEGPDNHREKVAPEVVIVLPRPPFVLHGDEAIRTVADTPTWDRAWPSERTVSRPQEGLIVVGYLVRAERDGQAGHEAWCTSTIRRNGHEVWRVVQHQQLPALERQD